MKSAFWDTLKNGQFQCKSIPQRTLDLIEYIQFLDKMGTLSCENVI